MSLVIAERRKFPRAQREELQRLEGEVRTMVNRLRAHPLLQAAVLAELLGAQLAAFVEQQQRYGPAASPAACNVENRGFGGL